MENQHRKIKGYRELSQKEIDLMNEIKVKSAELGDLVEKVNRVNASLDANSELSEDAEAFRWASIARTHYQQGSMALTRAVAKPEFF